MFSIVACNKFADNSEFEAYYKQSKALRDKDSINQAITVCNVAVQKATNPDQLGRAYWLLGYLFDLKGDEPNAQAYYLGSADAYQHVGDKKTAIILLQNAGTVALHGDAHSVALQHYRERLRLAKEIDDKHQITLGNYEVGLAFFNMMQLDSANHYQNNVIDLTNGSDSMAAKAYLELGRIQYELGRYDSARFLYHKAGLKFSNPSHDYKVAQNIANAFFKQGHNEEAVIRFRESLKMGKKIGTARSIMKPTNQLGLVFADLGLKDSAIYYLSQVYSIAKSYENPSERKKLNKLRLSRSSFHALTTNYEKLNELDPDVADAVAKETMMSRLTEYLSTMEVLEKENRARSIQLANSERNKNRLQKRLEEYEQAALKKNLIIGVLIFIFIITTGIAVWRRRKTIAQAKERLEASQIRMNKISEP